MENAAGRFARILEELEGNAFESEVCAFLSTVLLGFQTIPAKPSGDGSLDGLSHNGERGYCCYGQERSAFKTGKARERALIKKFRADLAGLFEVQPTRTGLVHSTNKELSTILPRGKRLRGIRLISNWFESHRVIGPIQGSVDEYRTASKLRHVASDVEVVILGPKELVAQYGADETAVIRAAQRRVVAAVESSAPAMEIKDPRNFEAKMETLRQIRPDVLHEIERLESQLLSYWRKSLAFEQHLTNDLPALHQALERSRSQILTDVIHLRLRVKDMWAHMGELATLAETALGNDFGRQYSVLLPDLARGEVARLIGECAVDWPKGPM